MKKTLSLILSLHLWLVSVAHAYPSYLTGDSPVPTTSGYNNYPIGVSCEPSQSGSVDPIDEMSIVADQICVEALKSKGLPPDIDNSFKFSELLPMIGGCMMGTKDSITDEIAAIKWLLKLFVKELPSYVWNKVKSIFEDEDETDPLAQVEKASQVNDSMFKQAYNKALQYLELIKKFFGEVKDMIKKEFKSFFCLPKPEQARLLCRISFDVFRLFFAPGKFIAGAKWTAEVATAANGLIKTMSAATKSTKGLNKKIDLASDIFKSGVNATSGKLVSKLSDSASIVSKKIGDQTVYFLQTVSKDGEKVLREMVLDQHSGFFSINGQGKKVIDMIIKEGNQTGSSAAILLDVNNLGKVNYFQKGLTAGDDYIKTVSQVIKDVIGDNPNIRAFRTGGDELTLFTKGLSNDEVHKISKEINDRVLKDSRVQKIFRDEKEHLAKQLTLAKKSNNQELASNIAKSQEELSKMDGSITVGSHMIGKGDDYGSLQTTINDALAPAKVTYKKAIGLEFKKYQVAPLKDYKIERVAGRVAPPVLPPTGTYSLVAPVVTSSNKSSPTFIQRIEEAATIFRIGKKEKAISLVSRLSDDASIVSKKVGDSTVYYLQTVVNGEKVLREMVLDQHSGFFSINGQGKKVIDMLIKQSAKDKQGAAILLDVNNLGKVNYFQKGLTAGDEYLAAVSDVIRDSVKDNSGIRVFRTGGDELTLFTTGLNPDEVYKLTKEINDNVIKDPRVQKIFKDEKSAIAKQYGLAKKAGDTETIKELELVRKELGKLDGSVTIGSRMIAPKDSYDSIQTVINETLSPAKATYKKAIGMPYEKYGSTLDDITIKKVNGKMAPPVLRPSDGRQIAPTKKTAPRGPPKGISYNPRFEKHMTKFDGFRAKTGINGTHNAAEFEDAAKLHDIKIEAKIPHDKIKGLYQIEYRIPARDAKGEMIGHKKRIFQKTVYDPNELSDAKMISLAKEAAEEGFEEAVNNGQRVYDVMKDGINFRAYIKDGVIDNVHPTF